MTTLTSYIFRRNFHCCVAISAQSRTNANTATRVLRRNSPPSASPVALKLKPSRLAAAAAASGFAESTSDLDPPHNHQTPKINFEKLNQRVSQHSRNKDFQYSDGYPEAEDDRQFRLSNHFYRRLYPWKSKEELAAYLYHQIIYQAGI